MSLTASVPATAIPQYLGYLSKTAFIVPIRFGVEVGMTHECGENNVQIY